MSEAPKDDDWEVADQVWINGLPPFSPGFYQRAEKSFQRLDFWDRVGLALGGCLFGFSLGVSGAIMLIGSERFSDSITLETCILVVLAVNLLNCVLLFQASRLASTQSSQMHELLVEIRSSLAER